MGLPALQGAPASCPEMTVTSHQKEAKTLQPLSNSTPIDLGFLCCFISPLPPPSPSQEAQFGSYQSAFRDSVIGVIPQHSIIGLPDGCTIFKAEHGSIFPPFAKQVHEICHMAGSMQMTKQSKCSRNTRWGCQKDANKSASKKKTKKQN